MRLAQPAQVDTSGAIVEDVPSIGTIEVIGQRPAIEAAPSIGWPWLLVASIALWVVDR